MRVDIVTIFPEYFAPLELSLIGRARAGGLLDIAVHDLRTWTHDIHRTVDDTPYGGGPGMVMRPEPWGEALDALGVPSAPAPAVETLPPAPGSAAAPASLSAPVPPDAGPVPPTEGFPAPAPSRAALPGAAAVPPAASLPAPVPGAAALPPVAPVPAAGFASGVPGGAGDRPARLVVPTPAGARFSQAMAGELAAEQRLIFACGRYEGIDQRVLDHAATRMPVTEVSLGDYVLFGGEVAVLVMLEAIVRLVPGVLGNAESLAEESHTNGLLEAPVYTKPPAWRDFAVPDVLRSGDHGRIARWRRDRALVRTARRRPDLLAALAPRSLDKRDVAVLAEAGFLVPGSDMAE